jgi:Uma2 family endonuclease
MDDTVQVGMTLADFLDAQGQHSFELLDGKRLERMPNVFGHAWAVRFLFLRLFQHAMQYQLGEVFAETTYAQLEGSDWVSGSRIPDVAFYAHARIAQFKASTPDWRNRPLSIAPDLTVEVVSPTERASDILKKVKIDMAQGVRLIWVIDLANESATLYSEDGQIKLIGREGTLEGKGVQPHFSLSLDDFFKADDA